jgi:hypothetical protein
VSSADTRSISACSFCPDQQAFIGYDLKEAVRNAGFLTDEVIHFGNFGQAIFSSDPMLTEAAE